MLLRAKIAFLFISFQLREHSKTGLGHKLTVSDTSFAPCKGIQDGLGFWFHAVDSGFRVLDFGFQHSGFRIPKRAGFHFFTGFNAFLRTSFSCSNLAILKDVVRRHNKFVFFFDLQNYGKKCITVPAFTATPQKEITNTAVLSYD